MTAFNWVGGNGNWADAANWSPNGFPSLTGDTAVVDASGTYTITIATGEIDAIGSLTINAAGATLSVDGTLAFGGTNALTIDAGTLALGSTGSITGFPDVTVMAGATLDVSNSANQTLGSLSGGGLVLLGSHLLTVGVDGKSTTFSGTLQGGGLDTGQIEQVGTGTLTLDNATMNAGELLVGNGNLAVAEGTSQLFYLAVGEGIGSTGTATISGGVLNIGSTGTNIGTSSALQVGDFGGTGLVIQTGGTVNVIGSFNIGNQGGTGTYDLESGTLNLVVGLYNIGRNSGTHTAGSGTLNVSGGLLDIKSSNLVLGNLQTNTGAFGQSSGKFVQTGGTVLVEAGGQISLSAKGNGEYDLDGGTLEVGGTGLSSNYNGGGGTGTFHMGGGTLQVTGSNLVTSANTTLDALTTSTLSLGSLNASFTGTVGGAGTLDITGSGKASFAALNITGGLALDGSTVDFTGSGAVGTLSGDGTVIVDAGKTLSITGATAGDGSDLDVTVGAGATLDVSNSANLILGSLSGSGTVLLGSHLLVVGVDGKSTTFSGTLQGGGQDSGQVEQIGTGTLTLDGATMNQGELLVGSGNLAVAEGTSQLFYLAVGEGTGSVGNATISGGTLNIGTIGSDPTMLHSALQVGDFGGTGLITQTGGVVNITGSFNIGNQGGTGTYDLESGTLNLLAGNYDIGRNAGTNPASQGTVNVSGGLLDLKGGTFVLGNFYANSGVGQGSGKFVQTGGTVLVEGGSQIFLSAIGNGEYDLDGGTLEVGGAGLQSRFNGGGTGTFHMGGGTLQVTGSSLNTNANTLLDALTTSTLSLGSLNASFSGTVGGAGTLDIMGGGTASFAALNITGGLALDGSTVDFTGSGSVGTLSGDGTVIVDAGRTLSITGATAGDGSDLDVTVGAGATLDVSNSANLVLGSLSGSGLVLLGSHLLVIGVDGKSTTFSGEFRGGGQDSGQVEQIGAGTLTLDNATMNQGELLVGTGNLAVTEGTSQLFYLAVGEGSGSIGNATISGGTLNIGTIGSDPTTLHSSLQVGDFGGTGLITQTGGVVNITGSFNIGNQGGTGTYDLESGTLNLLAGNYDIGRNAGTNPASQGTVNVSGGLLDLKGGTFVLGNFYANSGVGQGSGKFVQTGGTVLVEGGSQIFLSAIGNGEYDLDGGTLEVGGSGLQSRFNGGGTGTFHMGGGTLQVIGSNLVTDANTILDALTTSTLALGSLNASFSGTVGGTGTLDITGGGTASFTALNITGGLALGGSTVDFTGSGAVGTLSGDGDIIVDAGKTLSITGATAGDGSDLDVTVGAGATLDVSDVTEQVLGSLSGSGTVLLGDQTLVVGVDGKSTSFSGTLQGAAPDSGVFFVQNGAGTLTLDGATMNDGEFQVGTGNVAITAGTDQLIYLAVGEGTGSTGNVAISGGTLNIGTIGTDPNNLHAALQVGDFGGTGVVTQTGGTVNITGSLNIGNQGGTGTYDLESGTINLLAGRYDIGRNSGGNAAGSGTVNVSGGLFDIQAGHLVLGNFEANTGTHGQASGKFVQTGGIVEVDGSGEIFLSAKGNGEYDLDGGTLKVGGSGLTSNYNHGGGTGTLHMGGGTLQVIGSSLVTDANTTLDALTTSTLALGSLNASFSGTVGGAGTLDITGSGTASFAGLNITGGLALDGSTIDFTGSGAVGTLSGDGDIIVDAGKTLSITGATAGDGSDLDVTVGAGAILDVSGVEGEVLGSLSGSGTVLFGDQTLVVGVDGKSTSFSGTLQGAAPDSGVFFVQNGAGTLTLNGATMNDGEFQVGTGNVAITAGTDQLIYLAVGEGTGSTGNVDISGGTLNIGTIGSDPNTLHSALQVGDFGGTGIVTQTGGIVNITGSLNIGNQGGTGTYDLESGTINLLAGRYDIGRNSGSNAAGSGTVNVSGGLFDIQAGHLVLGNFEANTGAHGQASGKFVQTGGIVEVDGSGQIFLSAKGDGEYDLDGGTLKVGGSGLTSNYNHGGGTGTLHMGGGTLQVIGSNLVTDANTTLDALTTSTLSLGSLSASFSGTVGGAGTLDITGSGTASFAGLNITGGLALDGSTVDFTGSGAVGTLSGDGTVLIEASRTLSIADVVGADDTIRFNGIGATLALSAPADFAGTITGFNSDDRIDFAGVAFDASGSADYNATTHILTVVENGVTYSERVVGNYTGEFFHLADDHHGGTTITEDSVACYCRGTLILTDKGEVAVEDLRMGDRLMTASGEARPIRWIGMRAYSGWFARGNKNILPIQIRQGALADNMPKRDLWVSPLHAMFLDGVLIPAFALVNGVSIVQAGRVDTVEYFHLELETHDVIVAEGALSESFVDDGSRAMFQNAADYRDLYPDAVRKPAAFCAPRVEDGEPLQAVRDRIAARLRPVFAEAEQSAGPCRQRCAG